MDPEKMTESIQFAGMLYQAVLSLSPAGLSHGPQVHRMAKALALVEVMAFRASAVGGLQGPASFPLEGPGGRAPGGPLAAESAAGP